MTSYLGKIVYLVSSNEAGGAENINLAMGPSQDIFKSVNLSIGHGSEFKVISFNHIKETYKCRVEFGDNIGFNATISIDSMVKNFVLEKPAPLPAIATGTGIVGGTAKK